MTQAALKPPGVEERAVSEGARRPARAGARRVRLSWTACRYLGSGLAINCLVGFLVLEAVLGIIFTVRATEQLSFDILLIFPVLLAAFVQAMSYTIPVALLFGTSLLVGRLNADREILALRSFGFSPLQLCLPAVALGAVLGIFCFQVNSNWVPRMRFANRNAASMFLDRLGYLGEGWNVAVERSSSRTIWIYHYDGPRIEGIFATFSKPSNGMPFSPEVLEKVAAPSYPIYLYAARAQAKRNALGEPVLELRDVNLFFDDDFVGALGSGWRDREAPPPGGQPPARTARPHVPHATNDFLQRVRLGSLDWVVRLDEKKPTVKDLDRAALAESARSRAAEATAAVQRGDRDEVKYWQREHVQAIAEQERRIALSLSAVLFPLAAFLVSLQVTSANRLMPFFLASTIVPAVFFCFAMLGSYLAREGWMPWLMVQLGNLALGLLSVVLYLRSSGRIRRRAFFGRRYLPRR